MKIALDPYMIRHLPLDRLPHAVAELGYDQIELSPRSDFLDWWVMPRATRERMAAFRQAMRASGVGLASLQPMYRWASPFEDERQWAVRCWKKAIEVAVEMECALMVSEFGRGASPERSVGERPGANPKELCEAAWFRSMDALLPILERERIVLSVEPHPEDWIEQLQPAIDIVTNLASPSLKLSYIAPHTFYYGDDMAVMIAQAAPLLAHVRVADTFDHRKSSQLRYIVNPPGSTQIRVHQHLDIGQGEIDWDLFFGALGAAGFDGVMSSCVFAWEDRAEVSSRYMRDTIQRYVDRHFDRTAR
ncbi:protein iolH [Burkholderia cepacia JBK9]|uniref:Sugar phosphate isomerase/epimerase n=1 Tax=Burkholderia arboris TaxID=488730 RepID=A0ABZ3DLH1_9BURK|nr:sugar phosphate isomerase/epimerase [Burkholderia arboris]ALX12246.1 protein iolH [Burkholderia cepacia JBK9]MCA8493071.1 sugar phosphate isomerase/epimerase [Burkholderia arboris]UTV56250.1 sugar phosphate isomerase/epimerase [Burkholderia arboris]